MSTIEKTETKYSIVMTYDLPEEHSAIGAVRWIKKMINNSKECDGWLRLKDTHNSIDDGNESTSLPVDSTEDAILAEISERNIDSILVKIIISECNVSVAINMHKYIVSAGIDKENQEKITEIENELIAISDLESEGVVDLQNEDKGDFNNAGNDMVQEERKTGTKADLEAINEIKDALTKLQKSFDDKIARDEHKNALFDNMHRELTKYQNGALDKKIDSMAMDIIILSDNVKKVIAQNGDAEANEETFKKLVRQLQGISEELEDILYRENIEPFSVPGDEVDVKKQKIIGTIDTDDESLNNKVAERGVEGYEKEDKVLRRENVKIYKYKESQETDNN